MAFMDATDPGHHDYWRLMTCRVIEAAANGTRSCRPTEAEGVSTRVPLRAHAREACVAGVEVG